MLYYNSGGIYGRPYLGGFGRQYNPNFGGYSQFGGVSNGQGNGNSGGGTVNFGSGGYGHGSGLIGSGIGGYSSGLGGYSSGLGGYSSGIGGFSSGIGTGYASGGGIVNGYGVRPNFNYGK